MTKTLDPREVTPERILLGLERNEFVPYFQPTVSLIDGAITSLEALVRWHHPECGTLLPGAFLGVAEASDLIVEIGSMMLRSVGALAENFRCRRGDHIKVWVNLAAQQLAEPERLLNDVRGAIRELGFDPRRIGFEVTESGVISDMTSAVAVLSDLRDLGFDVAIDDFGTGYASLTYLRRLPATLVKIDRSFVGAVDGSLADAAIVEAVTELSHALGLKVVAEGVETFEQLEGVGRLGVDAVQGFYFSRALPASEVYPMLTQDWCGQRGLTAPRIDRDTRAEALPGAGSPRAQLLMSVLDVSPDSVMMLEGPASCRPIGPRIVYVNKAFERETGYRAHEVFGKRTSMLDAPTTDPVTIALMADAMDATEPITVELRNQRANGVEYPCEITLSPILDERGKATYWLEVRRDRTEAYAAEHHRRADFLRHAALDDVVATASRMALEMTPSSFLADVGEILQRVGEVVGADVVYLEEIVNTRFSPLASWCAPHVSSMAADFDDDGDSFPEWHALLRTGETVVVADTQSHSNEALRAEAAKLPVPDRSLIAAPFGITGERMGCLGISMIYEPRTWLPEEIAVARKLADTIAQVMDRQRAEVSLARTQARLKSLVGDSLTACAIIDRSGKCVFANQAAADLLAVPGDDLIGAQVSDFVHADDLSKVREAFLNAYDFGGIERCQIRMRHGDEFVWAEVGNSRADGSDLGGLVMTARPLGGWPVVVTNAPMASVTVVVQAMAGTSSEITGDALRCSVEAAVTECLAGQIRVDGLPIAVSARITSRSTSPGALPVSLADRSTFSV